MKAARKMLVKLKRVGVGRFTPFFLFVKDFRSVKIVLILSMFAQLKKLLNFFYLKIFRFRLMPKFAQVNSTLAKNGVTD